MGTVRNERTETIRSHPDRPLSPSSPLRPLEELRELDLRHLWHPYTDINAFESAPYRCFERGEGVYLYDMHGKRFYDGISSWWATALGHSHPRVVEAIQRQAAKLQLSILGNASHPLAVELAHRIAQITPDGLEHVYFAADGASATEAALKIAIQYWWNIGNAQKTQFVALEDGYHGDTLGAVGVGFVQQFHKPFEKALVRAHVAQAPHCTCCQYEDSGPCAMAAYESMRAIVEQHHASLAAVIVEPLCQGAAGIRIYHESYLRALRELCDKYNVLLIADEIAVGFGRTGAMFACERAVITPDMMCLGKGLTAGYLPMSATIVTDQIYDSFRSGGGVDRTFYDGHTHCGNPITSAAALAAIDVYTSEDIVSASIPRAAQLAAGFERIAKLDTVAHAKTLGMIGMCSFTEEAGAAAFAKRATQRALDNGLFIRPLGNALYLWPPLVSTETELSGMLAIFEEAILRTG